MALPYNRIRKKWEAPPYRDPPKSMSEPAGKQLDALVILAKPNERIKKKKFKDTVITNMMYSILVIIYAHPST
jgi:hypothetical protein